MRSLQDKIALVTGGASGLGKAIAARLSADGARVVITDVQRELGQMIAAECRLTFLEQDVSNEARWEQVVRVVEEQYGGLDVLVNNAGIAGPMDASSPENASLSDWRRIFSINVEGVFLGCKAAIRLLGRARDGSIINISSLSALSATPHATAYGASKAAVWQLTKSVAQYCAQEGLSIRCNSVHPGVVRTPLLDRTMEQRAKLRGITFEQVIDETRNAIPMGDFTTAEDVAGVVSFLSSEDSRHMTGSQVVVDGGLINCNTFRKSTARGT